jgi:ribosomal protein S18 acetylase RimI-like enzyme
MNDSPAVRVRSATDQDLDGIVTCSVALLTEDAAVRDPRVEPLWALRHGRKSFAATLADPACLLLAAVTGEGLGLGLGSSPDLGGPVPGLGGEAATKVVGYLIGVLAEPVGVLPIRSATLRALYVAPEHRGNGTGAQLTSDFFGWARQRGAARAEVNAYAANEAGLRFYERLGFAARAVRLDMDLET